MLHMRPEPCLLVSLLLFTKVMLNICSGIAMKVEHFEMIFIRLLHFLAHHPDFSASHEDHPDISK